MITNAILAKHAKRIKLLERNTVNAVLEIGGLLKQVADLCEHGVYQDWIEQEFGWSYRTSVRYRSIFELAQKCQAGTFDDFNITLTALYFLAELEDIALAKSVLDAARTSRVTLKIARGMVETAAPVDDAAYEDETAVDDDQMPADDGDDDDTEPEDEGVAPVVDDREPSELAASLNVLLDDHSSAEWQAAIKQIGGGAELQMVISILTQVYREHCENDAIRAAADAAEARSRLHATSAQYYV